MSLQGKIYTKFVMALNRLVKENLKPDIEYNNINEIDLEEIKKALINDKKFYANEEILEDFINSLRNVTDATKKLL